MTIRTTRSFLAMACIAVLLAACDDDKEVSSDAGAQSDVGSAPDTARGDTATAPTRDLVDTAVAAGSFTTLATALERAGLVDTLKGAGPFTVFAPTDAAFAKLPPGTLDTLLKPENKAMLVQILTYHVVAGRRLASDVVGLTSATTVEGSSVRISVTGGTVKINDATVTATDILATNGVIHVIDTVLLPPAGDAGSGDAAVAAADARATEAGDAATTRDIVDTAIAAGSFTTLAAALTAADLVTTLKGPGPFTVFAPTDAAFAKLPAATLADLLKPENKAQLVSILTYHVVSGAVPASQVVQLTSAKTVQGANVNISVAGDVVTLNGSSRVVTTDVLASNGIIHVIDTVLMPPAATN